MFDNSRLGQKWRYDAMQVVGRIVGVALLNGYESVHMPLSLSRHFIKLILDQEVCVWFPMCARYTAS